MLYFCFYATCCTIQVTVKKVYIYALSYGTENNQFINFNSFGLVTSSKFTTGNAL